MPRSRDEHLVVQKTAEETLVYDLERHKAHCLNRTAASVWSHCDGQTTVREMAALLETESGLPNDESLVWMALGQLERAHLIHARSGSSIRPVHAGRRNALKRIGIAAGVAALLPAITSIVAPTAVSAATCRPTGAACTTSAQCCSGLCNVTTCA